MSETPSAAQPAGPLADLKVVEMGSLIAGPFCGQILGDFGAEVIKIEDPRAGDPMRKWGRTLPQGLSPWWPVIARNKQSVTLNLRMPEGQALARALIAEADVLIENFRPGALEKWGLGYAALSALNPRLIMARISGFGQTGPERATAAFDGKLQAMSGIMSITGHPETGPTRAGFAVCDVLSGATAAFGVSSALFQRTHTGKGQLVDVSMLEATLAFLSGQVADYSVAGHRQQLSGNQAVSRRPSAGAAPVTPLGDGPTSGVGDIDGCGCGRAAGGWERTAEPPSDTAHSTPPAGRASRTTRVTRRSAFMTTRAA